ncbi:class F sortase, partial [Streptomyces calidiresistens]
AVPAPLGPDPLRGRAGAGPPGSPTSLGSLLGEASTPPTVRAGPPVRLEVPGLPTLGVVPVGTDPSGAIVVPDEPDRVGWWAPGARPGHRAGTVLLVGHVDTPTGGPGPFAGLAALPAGARIEVAGADGRTHRYTVTTTRRHPADALPGTLFAHDGPPRLALVTCAGRYDAEAGRYEETLVLLARPVP